jgi:hypothetical protein
MSRWRVLPTGRSLAPVITLPASSRSPPTGIASREGNSAAESVPSIGDGDPPGVHPVLTRRGGAVSVDVFHWSAVCPSASIPRLFMLFLLLVDRKFDIYVVPCRIVCMLVLQVHHRYMHTFSATCRGNRGSPRGLPAFMRRSTCRS